MASREACLTVAIPTFNRREALLHNIEQAVADEIDDVADLLVIDDGSTDGTEAAILDSKLCGAASYIRHDSNLGYARTFLEVFGLCTRPYVMISADDDRLIVEGIRAMVGTPGNLAAAITSTVFETHDARVYRGRGKLSSVTPSHLRKALNHAPGIVYATDVAREYVSRVSARLEAGCSMAATYPQVLLGLLIAMDHRITWLPVTTVREGARLPSGITDASGSPYFSARSRVAQLIDFDAFLVDSIACAQTKRGREYARAVLRTHRKNGLSQLVKWVSRDAPDLGEELMRQAPLLPVKRPRATVRAWAKAFMGRW